MEPKFTKGPVEIDPRAEFNVRQAGTTRSIASTGGYSTNTDSGEHRVENARNARLIVAAFNSATEMAEIGCDGQASIEALKEMYEALEGLIALNRSPGPSPVGEVVKRLDAAEAALAKARGEVS